MERELLEAQERLLKKREELGVTENHTPSIMSFRDFIPKCVHGVTLDITCDKCEEDKLLRKENESRFAKQDREEEINRVEEEKQERELHPERFMDYIPKKFRTRSLDNFTGSEEVKKILKEYSDGFIKDIRYLWGISTFDKGMLQNPGSILLIGKTGCGKTHLAVSVVTELEKRKANVRCCFITAPELLLEIRATFKTHARNFNEYGQSEAPTENDVLDKYSQCELLILDDLGAEKVSDFTIQSLYLVIDRRNRNLLPTIVTTNLTLEEIDTQIDARMASRLADMKVIKLNLPDYRKKRG